jgi:hypothetical protein
MFFASILSWILLAELSFQMVISNDHSDYFDTLNKQQRSDRTYVKNYQNEFVDQFYDENDEEHDYDYKEQETTTSMINPKFDKYFTNISRLLYTLSMKVENMERENHCKCPLNHNEDHIYSKIISELVKNIVLIYLLK